MAITITSAVATLNGPHFKSFVVASSNDAADATADIAAAGGYTGVVDFNGVAVAPNFWAIRDTTGAVATDRWWNVVPTVGSTTTKVTITRVVNSGTTGALLYVGYLHTILKGQAV